ncbi:hypothetical protein SODALDRAFT_358075 [Sodiomyces alkalinus F11]|uniref:Uncharacterized protein n=1 Tax=Sodiomyces alkalinus (strain CBS 110278 / VKM F-3762 / F11) TaxID=1314773 RepID=A0A3N2PZ90_SODAK|nr:hypothetical protein SODALDRAFT_358075 [Sodiomyces alkalinus F11]ROT39665.1 hypothetical protein SODALDRAFT_358075 [Sodiomyces alkalinus F11]
MGRPINLWSGKEASVVCFVEEGFGTPKIHEVDALVPEVLDNDAGKCMHCTLPQPTTHCGEEAEGPSVDWRPVAQFPVPVPVPVPIPYPTSLVGTTTFPTQYKEQKTRALQKEEKNERF